MSKKHSHCSYCGRPYVENQPWPRACGGCRQISYRNPLPVAVLLLPVDDGLLCIRRANAPAVGELALPGGCIEVNETRQQAAARELREEACVDVDPDEIELFRVYSATQGDGVVLIFGRAQRRSAAELPAFTPCEEVSERSVLTAPAELAFPLHTRVLREFFAL